jgi:hypothetical protein
MFYCLIKGGGELPILYTHKLILPIVSNLYFIFTDFILLY